MVFYIIAYVVIYISFRGLSFGIDSSDKRAFAGRLLKPYILLVLLIWYCLQNGGSIARLAIPMLVAVGLGYTYPIQRFLTKTKESENFDYQYDYVLGIYAFCWLLSLQLVLESFVQLEMLVKSIMFIVYFCALLVIIGQWLYYAVYGKCIDFSVLQTVFYTYKGEIIEYFHSLGIISLVKLGITSVFLIGSAYFCTGKLDVKASMDLQILALIVILLVGKMLFLGPKALIKRCAIGCLIDDILYTKKQLNALRENQARIFANLQATTEIPENFGTFILVIGESANRKHMHAFGYERETTPWLSEMANNDNFTLFSNSYSSHVLTVECLSLALTNASQYKNVPLDERISITDIASKCNFDIYWYSNQGYAGSDNTNVSVIASRAKHKRWILQDYPCVQYDEKLLDYLRAVPQDGRNKLIVLHLKGSHAEFNYRYPDAFRKWGTDEQQHLGDDPYDNSILYTDSVLKQIFEYAKEYLKLQGFIYCSDHSTDVNSKRKPYFTGFDCVSIPFVVYLADTYKILFPETYAAVKKNADRGFTNDLLFEALMDILQTKNEVLNQQYSIANKHYSMTRNTLLTDLGKISIAEDNN